MVFISQACPKRHNYKIPYLEARVLLIHTPRICDPNHIPDIYTSTYTLLLRNIHYDLSFLSLSFPVVY